MELIGDPTFFFRAKNNIYKLGGEKELWEGTMKKFFTSRFESKDNKP